MVIKNNTNTLQQCVYKIPCRCCDKYYVGQTSKTLNTRIKQHKYSVRTGQQNNAIFIHKETLHHNIDWDNSTEIYKCRGFINRNVIESSIIKFKKDDIMNLSEGLYKLDPFIIQNIITLLKL